MTKATVVGKALALVLALGMILSFCSCGKNASVHTYHDTGYYTLASVAGDSLSLTGDALTGAGYANYFLDLREDGTGEMGMNGEVLDITWQDGLISLGKKDEFRYRVEGETLVHVDEETGNIWRYTIEQEEQTISFTTEDGQPIESSGLQIVSIDFSSEAPEETSTEVPETEVPEADSEAEADEE